MRSLARIGAARPQPYRFGQSVPYRDDGNSPADFTAETLAGRP